METRVQPALWPLEDAVVAAVAHDEGRFGLHVRSEERVRGRDAHAIGPALRGVRVEARPEEMVPPVAHHHHGAVDHLVGPGGIASLEQQGGLAYEGGVVLRDGLDPHLADGALHPFVDVDQVLGAVQVPEEVAIEALPLQRRDGAVREVAEGPERAVGRGDAPRAQRDGAWRGWAAERVGSIRDIACVVPVDAAGSGAGSAAGSGAGGDDDEVAVAPAGDSEPVTTLVTPIGLSVTHTAAPAESAFLRAIVEGRLLGRRRSNGPEVYVPPRDYCPSDGVAMGEYVEVADHGTVTTFGIVNVPFAGQSITPPYVTAYILLDGADVPIQHLVLGCEASEVRMGMRVRAAWRPEGERPASMQAITHFEPSGEPDADPDTYAKHL